MMDPFIRMGMYINKKAGFNPPFLTNGFPIIEKPLFLPYKNRKFLIMSQLFTAIVFFKPEKQISPRKYRNIQNVNKLLKFCLNSGAWYVNLYDKRSGKFEARKYVTEAL